MGGRVYGGLTGEERHARRREQLLDAGLEVFAARGWHGAKIVDVCSQAGLSPRYFYEHFADREALFLAVGDRIAAEALALVRAAAVAPGATPAQRVRGVLTALVEHFTADPRRVRVAFVESYATPALRAHRARLLRSFDELAARLMASLTAEPPTAAGERALALRALVLSGGVVEALRAAVDGEAEVEVDELVEELARLYSP